jgi:hypothetical protein
MVRVGFAVRDVGAALPGDLPVQDPVTARVFYGEGAGGATVWAVLDFLDFSPRFVTALQEAVHAEIGVPAEHIHVVTTHNHSVRGVDRLDLDVLVRHVPAAAREARDRAEPATVRYATANLQTPINYKRRLLIPELGGAVTFWYGIVAEERFSAEPLLRQVVRALVKDNRIAYKDSGYAEPVPEESFIDENLRRDPGCYRMQDGDPRVQVVVFENEQGRGIGSFVRFAVHIHACVSGRFYSSDFPHYVRAELESAFGGHSIFLTGPCANISPATKLEVPGDEKVFGHAVASAAITAVRGVRARPLAHLIDATRPVVLPIRPDFPADDAATDQERQRVREALGGAGLGLPERKRLVERLFWLNLTPTMRRQWCCVDRADGGAPGSPTVTASLGLLQLNDFTVLALPGETFWETGEAATAGLDASRIMTVTEHGRTALYMPPPEEWGLGGYESSCTVIDRDAEPILRREASEFIRQHLA